MRQLNSGEIRLFNVARDMGETNDLSAAMPEHVQTMARDLDAYLEKVGAWGVKEAYDTRQEELQAWIARDSKRISMINEKLSDNLNADARRTLEQELKAVTKNLTKHKESYDKVDANRTSARWF